MPSSQRSNARSAANYLSSLRRPTPSLRRQPLSVDSLADENVLLEVSELDDDDDDDDDEEEEEEDVFSSSLASNKGIGGLPRPSQQSTASSMKALRKMRNSIDASLFQPRPKDPLAERKRLESLAKSTSDFKTSVSVPESVREEAASPPAEMASGSRPYVLSASSSASSVDFDAELAQLAKDDARKEDVKSSSRSGESSTGASTDSEASASSNSSGSGSSSSSSSSSQSSSSSSSSSASSSSTAKNASVRSSAKARSSVNSVPAFSERLSSLSSSPRSALATVPPSPKPIAKIEAFREPSPLPVVSATSPLSSMRSASSRTSSRTARSLPEPTELVQEPAHSDAVSEEVSRTPEHIIQPRPRSSSSSSRRRPKPRHSASKKERATSQPREQQEHCACCRHRTPEAAETSLAAQLVRVHVALLKAMAAEEYGALQRWRQTLAEVAEYRAPQLSPDRLPARTLRSLAEIVEERTRRSIACDVFAKL